MVDNDALGEKGEQRFGEMCAEAGLICNKAVRDRAGWDFVVNFGAPGVGKLDQRTGALSCYVQVKTILDESRSAKLKLNMAERLAKEPKPSFIMVFKVDANKNYTGVFLIHIADNRLGAILRRLREEEKKDPECSSLHKKSISFVPVVSERIDLNGDSLRVALLRCIGDSLPDYIERKQASLKKLGFGEQPYSVTTTFQGLTESDMADVFLGLKGEIQNTILQVSETRFDITITEPESIGAVVFEPAPTDSCRVTYRASPADIPITFRGDVMVAPPMIGVLKARIRCALIDFVIEKIGGDTAVHYMFSPSEKRCTPAEWVNHWKFAIGLLSGVGILELQFDNFSHLIKIEVAPRPIPNHEIILRDAVNCLHVFDSLLNLCRQAGVESDVMFSYDDVFEKSRSIRIFDALVAGRQPPKIKVDAGTESILLDEKPMSTIAIGCFAIGARGFAIYGVSDVNIDDRESQVSLNGFKFKQIRAIPMTGVALKSFVEDAVKVEKIKSYLYFSRFSFGEEVGGSPAILPPDVPHLSE